MLFPAGETDFRQMTALGSDTHLVVKQGVPRGRYSLPGKLICRSSEISELGAATEDDGILDGCGETEDDGRLCRWIFCAHSSLSLLGYALRW